MFILSSQAQSCSGFVKNHGILIQSKGADTQEKETLTGKNFKD
jgi:hypothetical protein